MEKYYLADYDDHPRSRFIHSLIPLLLMLPPPQISMDPFSLARMKSAETKQEKVDGGLYDLGGMVLKEHYIKGGSKFFDSTGRADMKSDRPVFLFGKKCPLDAHFEAAVFN